MGSPANEEGRRVDETQHPVTLTKGFWMAKTDTPQGQWEKMMGSNPSDFEGENLPVENVSWDDVQGWLGKMNAEHPLQSGWKWVLPSEAQWEYACRAGTVTPFSFGNALNGREANCEGNFPYGTSAKGPYFEKTREVGSYVGNAWGLYDMHGNVYEWCSDYYGAYPSGSATDPHGAISDSLRVFRGGGWSSNAVLCRSANRGLSSPDYRHHYQGFRVTAVPSGR